MGGSSSSPPPPPKVEATSTRDFDRCFILFGKGSSGKSTLGNLLLERNEFKVHSGPEAFGLTKVVKSGETGVDPRIVYGWECQLRELLKMQIIDQPGTNDSDFIPEKYCEFLIKCIAKSKGEMCANFLILINLKSVYLSPEEFFSIINIAEIQSKSSYSFFPNAAIVFTHADTIDVNLNEENLERHLRGIITSEKFAHIGELIELVEGRYMFINGENDKPENRFHVLKELFHLTRTKLNVYINGYDGFEGKEMKRIFRADPDSNSFRNNFTKYDVEYYFNPDLNLFRRYEKLDLETEITQALNKLSGIGNGVSVIILLINLEEIFNEEIFDLFLNLPYTYQLGEDFKGDFWDYACIVFKGPSGDTEFVERNLERNSVLKKMVQKVKSRYFLVNNQTSSEECYENILNLVKRVKLDTEGKTYIDGTVLKEMRLIMEESTDLRTARKIVEMKEGVTNLRLLRDGIPIFKTKTGPKIVIKANNFFWSRKWISPLIGYFLLKNINPNKAKDFKEKYKNQTRVTTEEFAEVFLEVMKEM